MEKTFTATSNINIKVKAEKVWEALTNPEMVKEYLFGTNVKSDWKKGSSITYSGTWEGKAYEDKGTIIDIIPQQLLVSTYWSSFSGLEDKPENYNTVTYRLNPKGDSTELTISQDNIKTEESRDHSQKNWGMVLEGMKKMLEQ